MNKLTGIIEIDEKSITTTFMEVLNSQSNDLFFLIFKSKEYVEKENFLNKNIVLKSNNNIVYGKYSISTYFFDDKDSRHILIGKEIF